jgi:UDP-GlcNAc:undecaprenyl-phosphate GlcNAc-1-phosphate transferase
MPITVFLTAFIISFVTVPFVISLAHNHGALALPGKRHIHLKPTPKYGGIAIALSVITISLFVLPLNRVISSYLLSSALMLTLGVFDDAKGSDWRIKLIISFTAISMLVFGGGVWVKNLGNLFGTGEVQLGLWGIPFTYFAVFGVISAINLIDGLNGLACGISTIAFTSFGIFAYIDGNSTVFYLCLASTGATVGLFRYNYPKAKIFMGDSGSLFLGLSLSFIAILLTQAEGDINPMVPVVVLGVPIFDTIRVLTIRLMNKRHPFKADKTHIHHLMMRSGIHPTRVVKIIWTLSCLMSLLAFVLFGNESWVMMLVFCIFIASMGIFIENLKILRSRRPRKKTPPFKP